MGKDGLSTNPKKCAERVLENTKSCKMKITLPKSLFCKNCQTNLKNGRSKYCVDCQRERESIRRKRGKIRG